MMKNYFYSNKNKIKLCQKLFFIIIFINFLLFTSQAISSESLEGSIIYISKSGLGNYTTIQEGIDSAKKGDTIFVYNDTYYENIVIDKSISLIGENKNNTIIDGRNTGNVVKVNADNVTIEGFTIQHSGLIFPNAGINLSSNYNTIKRNIITDNFYGMTLYISSFNTIKDNIIQNDDHCGIYFSKSTNNTIIGNTIRYNIFNALGLYDSSNNNLIQDNNLSQNDYCAVNIRLSSDNVVMGNKLTDNYIGIHLPNSENIIENNTFINNDIDIDRESFLTEPESFVIIFILAVAIIIGLLFFWKKKDIKKKK